MWPHAFYGCKNRMGFSKPHRGLQFRWSWLSTLGLVSGPHRTNHDFRGKLRNSSLRGLLSRIKILRKATYKKMHIIFQNIWGLFLRLWGSMWKEIIEFHKTKEGLLKWRGNILKQSKVYDEKDCNYWSNLS